MFCKKCGSSLPDGTQFCDKCGAVQDLASSTAGSSPANPTPVSTAAYAGSAPVATKKKKTPLIIGILAAVVVVVIVLVILVSAFSGPSLSIDDVKTGVLQSYSSQTIGNAFNNYSYFEDISWDEFDGVTDDGEDAGAIVEFDATMTLYNLDTYDYAIADLCVQFYQDDTMESDEFAIWGIYIEDEALDDYDFVDILDCIYADEEFMLIPSEYGLSSY